MSGEEDVAHSAACPAIWLAGAALALVAAALYLYGAAHFPLSEPDEGRYAEIAREMLVRADWVTPHLNFVKYFEKPPLVYWTTAAAFAWCGPTELAARLPSLLTALLALACAVVLAARMYGATTAVLTLAILAFCPLFGFMAQTLTLDMSLTGWMTLAMTAVWFGWQQSSAARDASGSLPPSRGKDRKGGLAWYRVAYVATALALLVKGPVAAVLVGGAALPFLVTHGGWRAVRPVLDLRGIVLAAVIVLPWFILVSARNPEFLHFFVVDQHIARYLWTTEHGEPAWYFLPVLPVALAPWGLLPLFDPLLVRDTLHPRGWSVATRFLVIWAGVIVVFFSLSTSKLLTYVLPALPPLAILLARWFERALASARTASLGRLAWFFLIAGPITALCGVVLPWVIDHWRMPALAPYLVAAGVVLTLTAVAMRRAWRPTRAAIALALGWMVVFGIAVAGRGVANDYRALGLAARAALRPDDRLALYDSLVQGIPFYAQRRAIMVRGIGELKFGSQQGDQRGWFWSDDDLRREWAAPGRLFLVINRKHLEALQPPLDPPPVVVAAKDKKVLVVNREAKGVTGDQ